MDKRTLITLGILIIVVIGIPAALLINPGTREALFKATENSAQPKSRR